MKEPISTRSIFDDDPLLATEKKKYFPAFGPAWLLPAISFVVFLGFYLAMTIIDPSFMEDKLQSQIWNILIFCSMLLLALVYFLARKKQIEPDYKLKIAMPAPAILLVAPFLMLAQYIFIFGIQEWFNFSLLKEWDRVFLLISERPLFYCFIYFLVDPFIQEGLFRGIILDSFLKNYSPVKSILNVAAISFAFNLSPTFFLYSVTFSLIVSWIYLRTRNIGDTMYVQILSGMIPFVVVSRLGSDFEKQMKILINSPIWVGMSAVTGILCIIILLGALPQTNNVIK